VTSGIVDDDDRDELSALSMHGHENRRCPTIVCMKLARGYIQYQMGSVSYQVVVVVVVVGDVDGKRGGRKQES
jgi:hypothetical protein